MTREPQCPRCGGTPERSVTRWGIRDKCCGLWSWGGKPLADGETHEARRAAHAAFDTLWKPRRMTRGRAYRLLQAELGLSAQECHMATMDAETALRVPAAVERIKGARP